MLEVVAARERDGHGVCWMGMDLGTGGNGRDGVGGGSGTGVGYRLRPRSKMLLELELGMSLGSVGRMGVGMAVDWSRGRPCGCAWR